MSGTSHFWFRSRREKVLGLGPGPSQKYYGHGPGPKKNILVPVLFRKNFGAGPSQKNFWSRSRSKKNFWSRSRSKKEIWSRSRRNRDHFAHLENNSITRSRKNVSSEGNTLLSRHIKQFSA
jgi:hypothetical protein